MASVDEKNDSLGSKFSAWLDEVGMEFEKAKSELRGLCGMNRESNIIPYKPTNLSQSDADHEFVQALKKKQSLGEGDDSKLTKGCDSKRAIAYSSGTDDSLSTCGDSISITDSATILSPPISPSQYSDLAVQSKVKEYSNASRKSAEEQRLFDEIALGKGDTSALAKAHENIALYYLNKQGRAWKAVEFFREAWRLLRKLEDEEREAEFLEAAMSCMVKARRFQEAIQMAERRAELLVDVDSVAANEASMWVQDLKGKYDHNNTVRKQLNDLNIERSLGSHELDPLLRE
uniref:Uncharacterized protein n=1 Tax=Mucochytrium quahogii TaxID=96639 RepID=A0A7S2RYP2_9STRA|mmetsp:Transcript_14612/g.23787  ORF Transcript_14612/g.23787 Transcript_14612/m.23787 type:complete len:289 (+) Transcript_14612:536-1402(+)|eukprot:CAMPEP_0203753178 /NCGR_PEP_ID=MMETSP0098-20131031/6983_1 /ASSEMBLY_ACC=CAM_ASM_000208 /TAXON_ID=96639 /ORGANISM=" , Strain NY0313808BC1" /LENGTH=288 /DNA_ID=CAMNT_0050643657 /DNA_START=380 /DNA_END=1249 /DNA_ORIENTATION=-